LTVLGGVENFSVCILQDFTNLLLASTFNNAFITKLINMWAGRTLVMVVVTLKISLHQLFCNVISACMCLGIAERLQ